MNREIDSEITRELDRGIDRGIPIPLNSKNLGLNVDIKSFC